MSAALRAWWRSRFEVVVSVVVCLAIAGVAAANAEEVTTAKLAVGGNWRGLYDILVTRSGEDFGGSSTSGLVDPNFVTAAGTTGITLSQLAAIRSISEVAVAAPIGFVGSLRGAAQTASLLLVDDPLGGTSDLTAPTEVLRLTSTLSRRTSLGDVVLSTSTGVVQLARRSAADLRDLTAVSASGYPNGFVPQANDLYYQVPLGMLPSFPSTVIAVDPRAELALLGKRDGAYLRPLLNLPNSRTSANGAAWAARVDPSRYLVQQTAIQQAVANRVGSDPIVPLLVNSSRSADLSLAVSVERASVHPPSPGGSTNLRALLHSREFSVVANLTCSASALTTPFASPDLALLMPGSRLPKGETPGSFYGGSTGLVPQLVSRPHYAHTSGKLAAELGPEFVVQPKQVVSADGMTPETPDGDLTGNDPSVGLSRAYRSTLPVAGGAGADALAAPVGTFVDGDLETKRVSSASYVPSGVFDGSESVLTRGASSTSAFPGTAVQSNLTGVDFLSSPPGAFTDLRGGAALRGAAPIDAVRVRVAGVESYSPSNRARIRNVAAAIARLGLQATIVAGSSPESVEVYVPSYHVGAPSTAADLGWVRQSWTTLGAAVTVTAALTAMQSMLQVASLAAVLVAYLAAVLTSARRRRQHSRVLRDIGWTDRAIRRHWFTASLPTGAAVVIVAVASWWLWSPTAAGGLVVAATATLASATSVFGVAVAMGTPARRTGRQFSRSAGALTLSGFAWRHMTGSPGVLFLQVFGVFTVGVCTALDYSALATAHIAAGQTRLAGLATSSTELASLVLGGTGVAAAIALTALGRRAEMARRDSETRVLTRIGFERAVIAKLARREALAVVAAATTLALLAAAAISWTAGWDAGTFVSDAAACLLTGLLIAVSSTRKGDE